MAKVDVAIIGAGAAGLTAAALLAKEGKKVTVVEASKWLGGRGMAVPDEGFKLNLGGHLLEDSGSGITKVLEYVGKTLEHGNVSSDMPVWDHEKRASWGSIRDRYSGDKSELKKVIKALMETPYEALDEWDDKPLREWMRQYTTDQGVIDLWEFLSVLECMTDDWYDHSASDNLYVRKMHYSEARMAGYSFWPKRGWDGMFQDLHDAVIEHGGEVLLGTPADSVIIENGEVKGVMLGRDKVLPNEFMEGEVLEADAVISTLPVWNVLRVVPESALPDWYDGADQVPRPGPPADLVDRPVPGDARGGPRAGPARDLDLAARADQPPVGLLLQPVRDGPDDRARGREPDGRRRDHPGRQGASDLDLRPGHVRAVRGRPEGRCTRGSRTPTGAAGTWCTTRPSA